MASEKLRHKMAVMMAVRVVDLFAPCLREEERRDAYVEVMAIVLAGLESVEIADARATRIWLIGQSPDVN